MTLKVARVAAGFTQREAAKRLGVTPSAVCSWETGAAEPRASTFMAACRLYDVAPEEIFLPSECKKVQDEVQE